MRSQDHAGRLPVFLPMGSPAQLIVGLLVCFISSMVYSAFDPYLDSSNDRVAISCNVSLFFALVSSIVLRLEHDTSSGVLGVLLLIAMSMPGLLAFMFESDLDPEDLGLSRVQAWTSDLFSRTIGRGIIRLLGQRTIVSSSAGSSSATGRELDGEEGSHPPQSRAPLKTDNSMFLATDRRASHSIAGLEGAPCRTSHKGDHGNTPPARDVSRPPSRRKRPNRLTGGLSERPTERLQWRPSNIMQWRHSKAAQPAPPVGSAVPLPPPAQQRNGETRDDKSLRKERKLLFMRAGCAARGCRAAQSAEPKARVTL